MKFWDLVNAIREGFALDPEAGDFDYGEEDPLSTEDEEAGDDSTGLVPGMEFLGILSEALSEDEGEDGEDGEDEENEDPKPTANPFGTTVSTAADMAAFIERNGKDL